MIVWFTGLSGAGKTTISTKVAEFLTAEGNAVEVLDGDVVRPIFCRDLGFSRDDRDENIRRLAYVAGLLERHGVTVLVSAISPYRATRDEVRGQIGKFVEVFVNAPIEVCQQRDVKGLYDQARRGQLARLTGINDPYEPPSNPEVECRTDLETVEQSVRKVVQYLKWGNS